MAVIDQSTRVLVLIISHSLALDLFRRSKIDTQEMSLNIFSVFFFAEFSQVSSKVLFIVSNYIFVNHVFFWGFLYETLRDMRQLLWMGASFYQLSVGYLQHSKKHTSSCKFFSFLNHVSINSFQSCSLSTFIFFVFLFLGMKYNSHKIAMNFFVWVLFLMGFLLNTSFWLQSLLSIIKWQQQNKSRSSLSIYYWNLNRISGHNYAKLFLVRAYLAFHKFEIM